MKTTATRNGKIAALPAAIREELNRRLLDGQLGPAVLPWLNELAEAKAVVAARFGGEPINGDNLSLWRKGGFKEWLRSSERIEHTKQMATFAADLARSNGGRLAEGAQAIAGGRILALLEASGGNIPAEELSNLVSCLTSLRSTEIAQQRVDQDKIKLSQKDREFKLEREKFELIVCKKMLEEAYQAKAREISQSNLGNEEKIAALRQAYFSDVDLLQQSGEVVIPPKQ